MSINKKNILVWDGSFNQYDTENIAIDKYGGTFSGNDHLDINLFTQFIFNDSATFGIDNNTIEIVSIMEGEYPLTTRSPIWTPGTGVLRVFLPDDADTSMILRYRWKDKIGNYSNTANIYFNIDVRATTWIVYPDSGHCEITSGGQNTGNYVYDLLVQRYDDTGEYRLPLNTKANAAGDPDYIAPVNNLGLCPTSGTSRAIIVVHNNANSASSYPNLLLTNLTFKKTGFPDIVYNLLLGHGLQQAISVPVQYYDSIELVYSTGPSGILTTWSYVSNGPGNPFWQGTSNASPIIISSGYLIHIQGGTITVSI